LVLALVEPCVAVGFQRIGIEEPVPAHAHAGEEAVVKDPLDDVLSQRRSRTASDEAACDDAAAFDRIPTAGR
jgi:hypothetical protein